jgi:lambda repressor-like predicted transcriptional regulator
VDRLECAALHARSRKKPQKRRIRRHERKWRQMGQIGRGRPSKLEPGLADHLINLRRAGLSLDDSAVAAGVHPATLRSWLRRAWSREPSDARAVAFTRRWLEADALARADERSMREFEAKLAAPDFDPFDPLDELEAP